MSALSGESDAFVGQLWSYRFGQWLGRSIVFPALFSTRLEGLEHVPTDGAFVVTINHFSNFDPIIAGTYIQRPLTYAAKLELLEAPIIGLLYRMWGSVPVRRDGMDLPALRVLLRVLRAGGLVGMFPEGTRSRDGVLHRPVAGAAYLAAKAGVPIVPVGLSGTEEFSWGRRMRHGRIPIRLRVGPAFRLPPSGNRLNTRTLAEAGDEIMRHIAKLLPPKNHGAYARPGPDADG
jgi:1-acyl-sn-glycerol-3-phosphate acyltransferase